MTDMENKLYEAVVNGTSVSIKEASEKTGISNSTTRLVLDKLVAKDLLDKKMVGGIYYFSKKPFSLKKEEASKSEGIGNELQNILIDTIAKYSTGKVVEEIMPLIKQKVVEEFGVIPQKHEIKIGNAEPVKMQGNLPPCFDEILAYATNGNPVMLTGPAGTGKGFLARQVAKATGAKFFEVNAVKNSYDLTGFVDANSRFVKTPFYDACKTVAEGGKAVFLFDEMDCSEPEVLKIFNEALASFEFTFPNDEYLTFENLIILCACNTYGTGADEAYCGQQLDASTLDRFAMVRVDYDRKVELEIAEGDEELVRFIEDFRRTTERNGLVFVASYRSIKRIASMRGILPLKKVMKQCFIKSMAKDDLENVLENMKEKDNTYFKACNGADVDYPVLVRGKAA